MSPQTRQTNAVGHDNNFLRHQTEATNKYLETAYLNQTNQNNFIKFNQSG